VHRFTAFGTAQYRSLPLDAKPGSADVLLSSAVNALAQEAAS
jgi:hypothetical protein